MNPPPNAILCKLNWRRDRKVEKERKAKKERKARRGIKNKGRKGKEIERT